MRRMAALAQFEQAASPAVGAGCGGSVPACRIRRPRPAWPAAGSGSSAARPRCSRRGKPGPARCRSSPRRPSPRRHGAAPGAEASRCWQRPRACARCSVTETSSTKTCGASTTTPATASGKRAACSSAIEPPSLWPKSQGVSSMRSARQQRRQQLVRLAVHEVHAPALVVRARRGAAVAGARIHQAAASRRHRTAAAESRATSSASPGPRAGTPAVAGPARSRPSHSCSMRTRWPRQSSSRNSTVMPASSPVRASGSAGSCRWRSSAGRLRNSICRGYL